MQLIIFYLYLILCTCAKYCMCKVLAEQLRRAVLLFRRHSFANALASLANCDAQVTDRQAVSRCGGCIHLSAASTISPCLFQVPGTSLETIAVPAWLTVGRFEDGWAWFIWSPKVYFLEY